MKTDLEVEVEVDLRPLGKVLIFRDRQTHRTFLLYIDALVQSNIYMILQCNDYRSCHRGHILFHLFQVLPLGRRHIQWYVEFFKHMWKREMSFACRWKNKI